MNPPEQFSRREQRRRINDATGRRERAFAEAWDRWLVENPDFLGNLTPRGKTPLGFVSPPTKAEKIISKEIMSWLGTNCGMTFLEEALKRMGCKLEPLKAIHTSYPPETPPVIPKKILDLIAKWPGPHWMYTEAELAYSLGPDGLKTLTPYLLKEDYFTTTLYGLNREGVTIHDNIPYYKFCNCEKGLVSTHELTLELEF
jgi:hypothetical protein